MTKRISRTSLALVAAGLLASPFVAQTVADAQTVTSPSITLSAVSAGGSVPTGVTGVNVSVTCTSLLGAIATSTATYTVAFGAAGVPTFWPLTPAITGNTGSVCTYGAQLVGSANLTTGTIALRVGETVRTVINSQSVGTSLIATSKAVLTETASQPNNTAVTADATRVSLFGAGNVGVLPTPISTNVVVTVTFPGITVKKVVNGDEPVAGFAYPMTVACSNTAAGVAFIELNSAGAVPQGSLVVAGAGTSIVVGGTRYFDVRSTGVVAPDQLGTTANMQAAGATVTPSATPGAPGTLTPSAFVTSLSTATSTVALAPTGTVNGVVVFSGNFTLTGTGATATRVIGVNEFPGLRGTSLCEVTELNNQAGVTAYLSTVTNADGSVGLPLPGVQAGTVFKSALTAQGQTITVTNSFLGNLVISKVVTGDPKTNIATYEISVACDKGGPKDTFLLKDRQSKVYSNLIAGTNCLVTETRSDGAVASYSDNSGDNTTDGRVTIKRVASCGTANTVGAPTVALPGGPTIPVPVLTGDNCDAHVIITNNYNVVETTTTTAAPAATTTAAPVTTAAPAVTPAPATPVEATPTFTG